MKSLIAGIVLIIVLGIGGFIYRNVAERTAGPAPTACTAEAKVCPDGSSVGRSGPSCAFAPCAAPNVELAKAKIAFALPAGFAASPSLGSDDPSNPQIAAYEKPGTSSPSSIIVYDFPIPEGKTANDVMLSTTLLSPSDMHPDSLSKFKQVSINGKTFQSIVIERFEGVVESAYYLARSNDVLRFDVIDRGADWTNPDLVVGNLPGHGALLKMLATLQTP